jgi:hypothetical protein
VRGDVGFIDAYVAQQMERHLEALYNESGVDVRFVFTREGSRDLESFSLNRARQLGMGRDTDRRGLLLVYDVARQRMRVEIGPGLEGIFPDGFVGYLMREQTAAFFAAEHGHRYTIVERGDLAILYFTSTPLVSAHLFRRSPAGWQLDLLAEVRDTREFIGGRYTWQMRLTGDDYSRVFADLFANIDGFLRPALGDNRPLPTRD